MLDLNSLNPPQRQAVTHRNGPALVLAGAGSGKTRVITFRIGWLIEQGVPPSQILGVTFTNKAATEMRERLAQLIGEDVSRHVHLSTFHSLGHRMLREDIERLGYRTPFTIVDDGDQHRIIQGVLAELKLQGSGANPAALLAIISRAKAAMTTPARHPDARYNPAMPRAQKIFDRYQRALKNLNAVDFDDLIGLPTKLLAEHEDLRTKWRDRFRYVMVDEYQDTNPSQLHMLQQLVGPPDHNLMVVGDDDQSIYAFRGAVSEYILNFERYFPNTRVIALEQNYRSVGSVLNAATAVIANNASRRQKTLWSELGEGQPIELVELDTDVEEASYIAQRIEEGMVRDGRRYDDFAILVRSNGQARALEEALRNLRIPYRIVGGQSIFDKKESRDVLAYLRLLVTTRDEIAVRRVVNYPARQIGTETLGKLDERAEREGTSMWEALRAAREDAAIASRTREGIGQFVTLVETWRKRLRAAAPTELGDVVREYIAETGLASAIRTAESSANVARVRVENLNALVERVGQARGETARAALEDYLSRVSLDKRTGEEEEDIAGRVTIMTLHSSKGLEFNVVFLCGLNDGVLPHWRALEERGGVEEERRLCYVGMTRARRHLILTRPRFAVRNHQREPETESRFLKEIPEALLLRRDASELEPVVEVNDEGMSPDIMKALELIRANRMNRSGRR